MVEVLASRIVALEHSCAHLLFCVRLFLHCPVVEFADTEQRENIDELPVCAVWFSKIWYLKCFERLANTVFS